MKFVGGWFNPFVYVFVGVQYNATMFDYMSGALEPVIRSKRSSLSCEKEHVFDKRTIIERVKEVRRTIVVCIVITNSNLHHLVRAITYGWAGFNTNIVVRISLLASAMYITEIGYLGRYYISVCMAIGATN